MKNILKKIFRYKLVSIYFIISQLVILTAVFGVLRIFNKAYAKENDRLNSIAENRVEINVSSFAKNDLLSAACKDVAEANVLAEGAISVEVQQIGSKNKCEVLLSVNEELPYKMISGHIPGTQESDYGNNCVALGRNKYKYAYDKDGEKYITINQEEYKVVGVIGSSASDYWDYKIVLNINCISDELKKNFRSLSDIVITVSSNKQLVKEIYNKIYENLLNADNACNIVAYDKKTTGESTISATLAKENLKTNVMVYVFCLINCIIISMFWVIQRRRELAIKRTFGYSSIRLILGIAYELLLLMGISMLIFIIGYLIYLRLNYINTGNIELWDLSSVISVFLLFLITLVITLVYPIIDIYRKSAEIIR